MVFLSNPEISFFEPVSEDLGEMVEEGEAGRQIGGQGRQCDIDGVKKNQYPSRQRGILKKWAIGGGWVVSPFSFSS